MAHLGVAKEAGARALQVNPSHFSTQSSRDALSVKHSFTRDLYNYF